MGCGFLYRERRKRNPGVCDGTVLDHVNVTHCDMRMGRWERGMRNAGPSWMIWISIGGVDGKDSVVVLTGRRENAQDRVTGLMMGTCHRAIGLQRTGTRS